MGLPGAQAAGDSLPTAVSPTGRYVVFTSSASNLAAGDSQGFGSDDVFVRDRDPDDDKVFDENNAQTILVSHTKGNGPPANQSDQGSISADGRYVAFASGATNLVEGRDSGGLFVRDLVAKTTIAVGSGRDPSISADGRYVAFAAVDNTIPGDNNSAFDVFRHDLVTNTTTLVSRSDSGAQANGHSLRPSISGNGRFVAFDSPADNLVPGDDGRSDVFVRDLRAGTLSLVSRASDVGGAPGAPSDRISRSPSLSADGRFVAFSSNASNFVAGGGLSDVYVRDLQEGKTEVASRSSGAGAADANNHSNVPLAIAGDGGFAAFSSKASNLVTGDLNGISDVFRRELGPRLAPPSVSVGDVRVVEGDVGEVDASFVVSLSRAVGQAVVVDFATADASASAGEDYVARSGSVLIAPGQTSATVTVKVSGDVLGEPDERFFVNLSNADRATVADGQGEATIVDDDEALSTVSVGDVSVSEGDAGTVDATFAVSLSGPSGRAVDVDFATADGTATATGDYLFNSGTVSFAAGETVKTVTVKVIGDTLEEPQEQFFVRLAGARGATVGDGEGVGVIFDNDAPTSDPSVSIGDVSVLEGDAGVVQATFAVSLSPAPTRDVVVDFATANDSATAPGDYQTKSGSVTIAAGQTTGTVSVAVAGDRLDEPDERFFVNLSNARGAVLADGQGAGTIVDDDAPPVVAVADSVVTEGDSGDVQASFTFSLSQASGRVVTVDYATADDSAVAPGDYAAGSGSVTFAAGDTTKTVTVAVNGDLLDEIDERFDVKLADPQGASMAAGEKGVATIIDNDAPPVLAIADTRVTEGDSGEVDASFTVSLSAPSGREVSVDFATVDGSAVAPGDYGALTTKVAFAAGQTTKDVVVKVKADTLDEPDERFFAQLANPVNAMISDDRAGGLIIDDDAPAAAPDPGAGGGAGATGAAPDPGAGGGAGATGAAPASSSDAAQPAPAPAARDSVRPTLSGLSLSRSRLRPTRRGARSSLAFKLSEVAAVKVFVQRAANGRRVGGRCVAITRANRATRRCTRYKTLAGGLTHQGRQGANTMAFSGRLGGRALAPGRYRLRVVATDTAGNRSAPRHISLQIMSGR